AGGARALEANRSRRRAVAVDGLDGPARNEGAAHLGQALKSEPGHLPARLWWLLAGLTLAWGFNWTAMKVALSQVPPWTFRALCLGLGSLILFAALRAGGQSFAVPKEQRLRLVMLAIVNITCWN